MRAIVAAIIALLPALAATGCGRARPVVVATPLPSAPAPGVPAAWTPPALTPLEPDYTTLPRLEATSIAVPTARPVRGLTELQCMELAAARVTSRWLLRREEEAPVILPLAGSRTPPAASPLSALRSAIAAEQRNRGVADALAVFYQLAEVLGRSELLRLALNELDGVRRQVLAARAQGAVVDLGELDRQRASTLALLGQVELGARLLDVELRRRIGATYAEDEQLRPSGDFGVSSYNLDVEAAVATALTRRPDLVGLRTVYLKLAPENLAGVREYLRGLPGSAGLIGLGPQLPIVQRSLLRQLEPMANALGTALALELELRRQQLWLVIAERERGAADEVRASAAVLQEQVRQVGLARWRAEQAMARAEELKKEKGAVLAFPAVLEASRARGEVITAVMNWHQARIRFLAAQGRYAGE